MLNAIKSGTVLIFLISECIYLLKYNFEMFIFYQLVSAHIQFMNNSMINFAVIIVPLVQTYICQPGGIPQSKFGIPGAIVRNKDLLIF